ncbi:fimbrial biogenesis chaperone [Pseudothauera lacus]|nr:hypothetical protein [Pseudothauera lacus]
MLVSPIRLLLTQPGETANFILRNPSNGPRTYRLEWIEQEQGRHGVGSRIQEGAAAPHPQASPHLRVTPRQITVEPNSNQTVRVSFRPDGELPPGEYRSHLLFRVVPEVSEPISRQEISGGEGSGVTLQLDMQLSISVPVVVRHQLDGTPAVRIAEITPLPASANEANARLMVLLRHTGNASSFGRVTVDLQKAENAPVERIGQLDNISIFPDVGERELTVVLRERSFPSGSMIRVAYEGSAEYRGTLWHEQIMRVR